MQWPYYALNPWLVPWYYLLELIKIDTGMVIPLDGLIGQLLGSFWAIKVNSVSRATVLHHSLR